MHPDAFDDQGRRNDDVAKLDVWYSDFSGEDEYVVEDRNEWLLTQVSLFTLLFSTALTAEQKSSANHNGEFLSEKVLRHFQIPLRNPVITITTVFTTNTNVKNHDALKAPDGKIHKGLEPEEITRPLPPQLVEKMKKHGWVKQLSPGWSSHGKRLPVKPHLEFWCQLAIRHDNKTMEVGVEVVDPASIPFRRKFRQLRATTFN